MLFRLPIVLDLQTLDAEDGTGITINVSNARDSGLSTAKVDVYQ